MTLRSLDGRTNQGLDRVLEERSQWWDTYTRPLRVVFPALNTQRDIAHGLLVIPDGFLVVYADTLVTAEPGVLWTPTLAYLRASTTNGRAIVIFYTLREDPIDA